MSVWGGSYLFRLGRRAMELERDVLDEVKLEFQDRIKELELEVGIAQKEMAIINAKNKHLDERLHRAWLDNRALKRQLQRKDGCASEAMQRIKSSYEVLERGVMLPEILKPQPTEESVTQRMRFFQRVEDSEEEPEEGSGGRSDVQWRDIPEDDRRM